MLIMMLVVILINDNNSDDEGDRDMLMMIGGLGVDVDHHDDSQHSCSRIMRRKFLN